MTSITPQNTTFEAIIIRKPGFNQGRTCLGRFWWSVDQTAIEAGPTNQEQGTSMTPFTVYLVPPKVS